MHSLTFIFEGKSSPKFRAKDLSRARDIASEEIIQRDFPQAREDIRIEERAQDILENDLVSDMRHEKDEVAQKIISRIRFSYPNSVVNCEIIFSKGSLEFTAIVTIIEIASAAYIVQQTVDNVAIAIEKIVSATIKEHAQTSSHMHFKGVDIGNMSVGLVSKSSNTPSTAPIQANMQTPSVISAVSDYHNILRRIYVTICMLIAIVAIGVVLYGYDIYLRTP